MLYSIIIFILLLLIVKYDIKKHTKNKDKWYAFMLLVFVLIAGLRYRLGGDTVEYLDRFYFEYPSLYDLTIDDFTLGKDPLYVLLNSIIKTFGFRFYVFQILHATIINILIFKYIKRHTEYIFASLLFYAIGCYTTYNMEILRGSLSIVLCLYAYDYLQSRCFLKSIFLFITACFFHVQTILILITPLFLHLRLNMRGIIIIACVSTFSLAIFQLGDFLTLFSLYDLQTKYDYYTDSGGFAQEGNPLFLLFTFLPEIFYTVYGLYYIKKKHINSRLINMEGIIMIGIMFLILQFSISIFYRYTDYYRIYFAMLYGELFIAIIKKTSQNHLRYSILHVVLFFLPMFIVHAVLNPLDGKGRRYYPYSSVIEKSIDKDREKMYSEFGLLRANDNIY